MSKSGLGPRGGLEQTLFIPEAAGRCQAGFGGGVFSLTQSLRVLVAKDDVRVHAVLTGPVDTDMTKGSDIPKAAASRVAQAIFDGVEYGEEEIFPDPMSAPVGQAWHNGAAKALEPEFAKYTP